MANPSLVVVLDGLRPDYINSKHMPNLCTFSERGIVSQHHHAVYPSKTRVQSASIATGCFPGGHGIINNSLWLPEVKKRPINTGEAEQLLNIEQTTGIELLTTPSLGEILQSHNKTLFASGSCTTGANLLLNHKRIDLGVANARGFIAPASHSQKVKSKLGPFPETRVPNTDQNQWAIDAYQEFALEGKTLPDVSFIWISDPDITTHEYGVGHPQVLTAVERVDKELGRLFDSLQTRNLRENINVFVVADHGLSTDNGDLNISKTLANHGLEEHATVIGNTQIYIDNRHSTRERIVRLLQQTDGVGALFTSPQFESYDLKRPSGTIPMDCAQVNHDRSPDVLVAPEWSHDPNVHGYPGSTSRSGTAGHGTLSPYEMRVRLVAAGPDLKRSGRRNTVPTGHVDIAPTLLKLQNIQPPDFMQGRILYEMLITGPNPDHLSTESDSVTVTSNHRRGFKATLERAHIEGVTYPSVARIDRGTA